MGQTKVNARQVPSNPPVNADARDVPASAKAVVVRAGHRER